ncbi:MAG: RNA methyltransferase [Polyangiaceae bacterium]|nr:RNA methyltransferase [Polyangiaceae bacterium]
MAKRFHLTGPRVKREPAAARRTGPRDSRPMHAHDPGTIFGLRAVEAAFRVRPDDVRAVYANAATAKELEGLSIHPRIVTDAVLRDRSGSDLHEGVVAEVLPRSFLSVELLADRLVKTGGIALALDRVRNPYNIGAILRSAAFFGLDACLFGGVELDPMALRVSEGGAEELALARTTDLAAALTTLAEKGFSVVAAEADAEQNLYNTRFSRPLVLVLGNERDGLSDRVRKACTHIVSIPSRGVMESLNVGMCASLMMAEVTREELQAIPSRTVRRSRDRAWK